MKQMKHQTSARSSKQLPARGWGLLSSVISTVSSINPKSFTVSSWMSEMLLNITSMSCKHKPCLSPAWDQLFIVNIGSGFCLNQEVNGEEEQKAREKKPLWSSQPSRLPWAHTSLPSFHRILPRSCCAPRTGWDLDRHFPFLLSLLPLVQSWGDFQEEFTAAPSSDPPNHRCNCSSSPGLGMEQELAASFPNSNCRFSIPHTPHPSSALDSPSEFPPQRFLCPNLPLSSCQCPDHSNPLVGTWNPEISQKNIPRLPNMAPFSSHHLLWNSTPTSAQFHQLLRNLHTQLGWEWLLLPLFNLLVSKT